MIGVISSLLEKVKQQFRFLRYSRHLGTISGYTYFGKDITLYNPQCVHIGKIKGIGDNTYIGPVTEYAGVHFSPKIVIGDGTWIGKYCSIAAVNGVIIGRDVLFAGYVHITDHSHGFAEVNTPIIQQPLVSKGPIIIEDQCWLGFSCEILSGVHIGKHSIVGARAVVTKDIPPYSVVAGNPARIVKQYNFETKTWVRTK